MRESYRAKQSRRARINKEKEERFAKNKKRSNLNRGFKESESLKINQKKYDFQVEEKEYEDIVSR